MATVHENSKKSRVHPAVYATVYTAMFAALIAVCSILSIPIGSVPVTLQTFAVCLSAALLGWKCGVLSVLVYILLGAAGLPVFAGMAGGVGVLIGPTGGYIVGFLPTAALIGLVAERSGRRALPLALSMIGGVLICYAVGTAWFTAVTARGIGESLLLCVVPFLIPDALKIAAAMLLSNRLYKTALFIKL